MQLKLIDHFLQLLIYKYYFCLNQEMTYIQKLCLYHIQWTMTKVQKQIEIVTWVKWVTNISEWENWIEGSMTSFTQQFEIEVSECG